MSTVQKITQSSNKDKPALSIQIQQAITSLHLEGVTLSDESMADLLLFSRGELSKEEVIKRVLSRVRSQTK